MERRPKKSDLPVVVPPVDESEYEIFSRADAAEEGDE